MRLRLTQSISWEPVGPGAATWFTLAATTKALGFPLKAEEVKSHLGLNPVPPLGVGT